MFISSHRFDTVLYIMIEYWLYTARLNRATPISCPMEDKERMRPVCDLLPHDALLARYMLFFSCCVSVRLTVCHKPALYQNS